MINVALEADDNDLIMNTLSSNVGLGSTGWGFYGFATFNVAYLIRGGFRKGFMGWNLSGIEIRKQVC